MRNVGKRYRKHFLTSELAAVTFFVALTAYLIHVFVGPDHLERILDGSRAALYAAASTACAALLGFIITVATITDAVMQSPQWERFRKSPAYSQVQDIYFDTIRWLGIGTLIYLIILIVDTDTHPQLWCEVLAFWLVCVLVIRMWRSIHALETLLRMNSWKKSS